MICSVCYDMLRGHQGSQWRGTFDLHFDHQVDHQSLKKSAGIGCIICRSLLTELSRFEKKNQKIAVGYTWMDFYKAICRTIRLKQLGPKERIAFTSAYLSEIFWKGQTELSGMYRLDFRVQDRKPIGTFVLQRVDLRAEDRNEAGSSISTQSEDPSTSTLHTPFSNTTKSDEVLSLARDWITTCCSKDHKGCPEKDNYDYWYPSRLIDLGDAYDKDRKRIESSVVRLVSTEGLLDDHGRRKNSFYVTLSHCWGKAKFTTLTDDNKTRLLHSDIKISTLPRTFQDAIYFARRLSKQVRYLWIDSLCIIQGNRSDWLKESAVMYNIYRNSYCNISATASADSEQGLFFRREPRELWEDDINLNVEGIPGNGQPWQQELQEPLSLSVGAIHGETEKQRIERCRILDVSFWDRHVDDAPVNRRGWVLQERLMAPRVLHFCQSNAFPGSREDSHGGQVAWECRELEAAESARSGFPIYRVKAGDIVRGGKLKSLVPHVRENPFNDISELSNASDNGSIPRTNLAVRVDLYECWKLIVEVYSRTRLTKAEDKLIALSGIASMMHQHIHDTYLAGMWKKYLACQLLWYVEPVFEDGRFYYQSERPKFYRAPSFSWAAIDAPQGVKFGDITDMRYGETDPKSGKPREEGLLIAVSRVSVTPVSPENEFGLVKDPETGVLNVLELRGVVKKIELRKAPFNGAIRYEWNLVTGGAADMDVVNVITHRNVYLDSPESEVDILGPNGQVYCLPARKDSAGYLTCLLLQLERKAGLETGRYKRIGLARIPRYEVGQEELLKLSEDGEDIPHGRWHAEDKMHTIEIV